MKTYISYFLISTQIIYGIFVNGKNIVEDQNQSLEKLFRSFMKKYDKVYSDEAELSKRLGIFAENVKRIEELQKNERGTAQFEINKFADLSPSEFQNYLGYLKSSEFKIPSEEVAVMYEDIPDSYDWRDHGAVTAIKNQANCGSCWAFSVTGTIEGQWAIHKGKLISLSEQQLLDCDYQASGCGGGNVYNAFEYVINSTGLETEQDYPYMAEQNNCSFNKAKIVANINSVVTLSSDEEDVAQYLYRNGPVSAAINAYPLAFYKGGIYNPSLEDCDPLYINHAILIVGYGVEDSKENGTLPYWIIKNSWGEDWGEKGYLRLHRGSGACGIDSQLLSVSLK